MRIYFPGLVLALLLGAGRAGAQEIVQRLVRIPMTEAGAEGLETLLVYPGTPGKHPLAILSHGSPRDARERASMTPYQLLPQALEFARRGWAVAVVMRRGYGSSGGGFAESWGTCASPDFAGAGEAARADLRAAIAYLSSLPVVDARRVLAVGISAGGFATAALAADPPPGLVAGISFAGGRGSQSADRVCAADALVDAFREFGATAKTPMLWVYAENDHFFGPVLALRLLDAFRGGGDEVRFVAPAPFGEDGHFLFSRSGAPIWTPIVDDFLKSRHLALVSVPSSLPAPSSLSGPGLAAWKLYLSSPLYKAFAVSPSGRYGWRTGRASEDEARAGALAACGRPACAIAAIEDALAAPGAGVVR